MAKKRPTADITITMDHTDNSNSDNDASDLTVYFDDNYLIESDVPPPPTINLALYLFPVSTPRCTTARPFFQ